MNKIYNSWDITGIYNEEYELIATYEYDSYGKVLSIKDANGNVITDQNHIANRNPFRYRSYYYDIETNLYYLNSRYYNPEWGRFLNADGIIGTNETYIGYNLYAYCENDPIIYKDVKGDFLGAIGTAIENVGKKIIQAVTTVASSAIGMVLNMPVSASMLNKSMNNPNNKINSITERKLTTKVKKSSEMKNEINKCVSNNKNQNSFKCEGTINGKTGFISDKDLQVSVGKASYIIQGTKNSALNTINLDIKVYDKYDFDRRRDPWYNPLNAANNFGLKLQNNGLLTPYEWDINYKTIIFDEQ